MESDEILCRPNGPVINYGEGGGGQGYKTVGGEGNP